MRATQLVDRLKVAVRELKVNELVPLIDVLLVPGASGARREPSRSELTQLLLESSNGLSYLMRQQDYSALFKELEFGDTYESKFFSAMFVQVQVAAELQQIATNHVTITMLSTFRSELLRLKTIGAVVENVLIATRIQTLTDDEGLAAFRIYPDNGIIAVDRVSRVIKDLDGLHQAVMAFLGAEFRTMEIAYAESGSPLDVGLKTGKVIAGLMTLAYSAWSKFRRLDLDILDAEARSIGLHVDVMDKVVGAIERGRLDPVTGRHAVARIARRISALSGNNTGLAENEEERERAQMQMLAEARNRRARIPETVSSNTEEQQTLLNKPERPSPRELLGEGEEGQD